MNSPAIKLIGKYALLLSIFYLIEFLFNIFMNQYVRYNISYEQIQYNPIQIYLETAQIILPYILNISLAFILAQDKRKFKITGKYAILLCLFYRPIGVVLFLIYAVHQELNNKPVNSN